MNSTNKLIHWGLVILKAGVCGAVLLPFAAFVIFSADNLMPMGANRALSEFVYSLKILFLIPAAAVAPKGNNFANPYLVSACIGGAFSMFSALVWLTIRKGH